MMFEGSRVFLSFTEGAGCQLLEPGTVLISTPDGGDIRVGGLSPMVVNVLREAGTGRRLPILVGRDRDQLVRLLVETCAAGLVLDLETESGRPILRTRSDGLVDPQWPVRVLDERAAVVLDEYVFARRVHDEFVVESPMFRARIALLHPAAGGLLTSLVTEDGWTARTLAKRCRALMGVELGGAAAFVDIMSMFGVLGPVSAPVGATIGAEHVRSHPLGALGWDPVDLLFHTFSRGRSTLRPNGQRTTPVHGSTPSSARKGLDPGLPRINLPTPALGDVCCRDLSLTEAVEARRSVRTFGHEPLSSSQVGEFLYRTARVRWELPAGRAGYAVAARPYPSAGSAYDLEVYLTVGKCAGVPAGCYYYDGATHALVRLPNSLRDCDRMLARAERAIGASGSPTALVTLTSRFNRVGWKYSGIAYALILRNVGVLFQTMYLVATAMGIGACAIGNGDSVLTARILGLRFVEESAVGEFVIGPSSTPAPSPPTRVVRQDAGWDALRFPPGSGADRPAGPVRS